MSDETDLATLGIKVDASQVTPAATQLGTLTQAGAATEKQTFSLVVATKALSDAQRAGLPVTSAQIQAVGGWANAQKILSTAIKETTATQVASNAVVATGVATYRTLQEGINLATGVTQASIKSASASYAAFGKSLEGLSAIEAASGLTATATAEARIAAMQANEIVARGLIESLTGVALTDETLAAVSKQTSTAVVEANLTMAESMGALGTASVRSAAEIAASYEVEAASATESAAVQVAAHGAIKGSSLKLRESIVLLREGMRGDFTRMAGSASILLGAFGLLESVLLPLIAGAVVLGSAIAVMTQQINHGAEGTGDLTKGLGLTEVQLKRVKDKSVDMGDTLKAVMQVAGRDLVEGLGGSEFISGVEIAWNIVVKFISESVKNIIADIGAIGYAMARLAVGDFDFLNNLTSTVDSIKLKIDKFWSDIQKQARANALERILKQAGAPESDSLRHNLTEKTKLDLDGEKEQNLLLEKEIELAGLSNDQRAIAIAQYKTLLDLRNKGGNRLVNSAYGQKKIGLEGDRASDEIGVRRASLLNDVIDAGTSLGTTAAKATIASDPDAYIKKQKAAYAEINALVRQRVLTETQGLQAIARVDADVMKQRLSAADDFFGNLASLSDSKNKELAAIGKAAAIAQATIDGILAVQKALSAYPPPLNFIEAGAVGVAAAANVAKIAGFDKGGWTGNGSPSDIAGAVHGQEFVVKAGPAAANRSALEAMNRGGKNVGSPNIYVTNNGTPQNYSVESFSEGEIRLIANDQIAKKVPTMLGAEASKKNSPMRKGLQQHTNLQSKMSA